MVATTQIAAVISAAGQQKHWHWQEFWITVINLEDTEEIEGRVVFGEIQMAIFLDLTVISQELIRPLFYSIAKFQNPNCQLKAWGEVGNTDEF